MIKVNAIGDACPIPVVKTKNAIRELQGAGSVETLVDNEIAVQNLTKMAVQKGFGVHSEKISENEYKVTMTVSAEAAQVAANSAGLSGSIAGGAEQLFGKKKSKGYEAILSKITTVGAILFVVLSLALVAMD